jgi:hypothetical protein
MINHPVESRARTAVLPPVMVRAQEIDVDSSRFDMKGIGYVLTCLSSLKQSIRTHYAGSSSGKTVLSSHPLKVRT